jgi:LysR family transcriptional regulator of gallate degradation
MVPALRRGELDMIVGYAPRALPRDGLVEEFLFEQQFMVIAAATHPLSSRKVVRLADLGTERWVLSESSLLAQQRLRRTFVERGLPPPDVAVETRSLALRQQLVAASHLLDYTSRDALEAASMRCDLKALPVKELAWRRPVSIVYREGAYLSPAARSFMDAIKAVAARRARRAAD